MAKKKQKKRGRPKGKKVKGVTKKPRKKKASFFDQLEELPMTHLRKRNTWYEKLEISHPELAAEILDIVDRYVQGDQDVCVRLPNITAVHRWLTPKCRAYGWEMVDRQAFAKFVKWREGLHNGEEATE